MVLVHTQKAYFILFCNFIFNCKNQFHEHKYFYSDEWSRLQVKPVSTTGYSRKEFTDIQPSHNSSEEEKPFSKMHGPYVIVLVKCFWNTQFTSENDLMKTKYQTLKWKRTQTRSYFFLFRLRETFIVNSGNNNICIYMQILNKAICWR